MTYDPNRAVKVTSHRDDRKRHRYDLEVMFLDGTFGTMTVDANDRSQAARVAEAEGYQVRSVNMVG